VQLFSEVASERRAGWQPQLPLELAFVEATLPPSSALSSTALVAQAPTLQMPVSSPAPVTSAPATPEATSQPAVRRAPTRSMTTASPREAFSSEQSNQSQKTAASGAAPAGVDMALYATVNERWRDVVGQLRPVNLGAFLRDGRPMGVDAEGFLVVGFQHTLHRNNVDKEPNRGIVETHLAQMFGQRILVRCVMEKEWQPGAAPAVSKPAAAPKTGAASQPRAKVAPPIVPPPPEPPDPLSDDELIRRAREELGAEVRIGE